MAIRLTNKEFDIEEVIEFAKGDEVVYSFEMKLTKQEVKEIERIITGANHQELIMKSAKLERENKFDEVMELQKELNELLLKDQDRFIEICFKEHYQEALDAGVTKEDIVDLIEGDGEGGTEGLFNFFWKPFIEKRGKQINSMTSDLRKIGVK